MGKLFKFFRQSSNPIWEVTEDSKRHLGNPVRGQGKNEVEKYGTLVLSHFSCHFEAVLWMFIATGKVTYGDLKRYYSLDTVLKHSAFVKMIDDITAIKISESLEESKNKGKKG